MKKRLLSILIAIALFSTMVLPVMAAYSYRERFYDSFQYLTTDTCNTRSFHCVIESYTSEYTLATNVETYTDSIRQHIYQGTPHVMISSNGHSVGYAMSHIICHYLLDGNEATSALVRAD